MARLTAERRKAIPSTQFSLIIGGPTYVCAPRSVYNSV